MEEVYCDFKYSGASRIFIGCAAAATLALLALAPFPGEARWPAFACVVALALHAGGGLRQPTGLRLDCARAIAVRGADGEWRPGAVCDGSFVAPWLVVVRWKPEGARHARALPILPDMLPGEAMRKIRVILKWA